MTTPDQALGGRLALLSPDDLSAQQRALYDQLLAKTVPWAQQSGFRALTEQHELIGPFNAMLRSPAIGQAIMGVDAALRQHSALSEAVQQVVILTVGAVWGATYELYAHQAVAHQAGLAQDAIQALAAGERPAGLSSAETLAYQLTQAMVTSHQLGPDLYEQALDTFGEKGLVDLLALAGQYMSISALLNAFTVPAPR